MVANALGYSRPNYFEGIAKLQEVLWLSLRLRFHRERPSREAARVLKLMPDQLEQKMAELVEALRSGADQARIAELLQQAIKASERPKRPSFAQALTEIAESLGQIS
jgi:hypothetical protein